MTDDTTAGDNGAAVVTIADDESTLQMQALDTAVIDVEAAAEEGERNDDDDEVEVIDDTDTTAAANAQRAGTAVEQPAAPGRTENEDVVLCHARNAKKLEEELQCVLCHDGLFKPVTATCGHSFCRVCLVESCLSRALDEAQCPVCRADVMSHFSENTPIVFHVNVTLWNLIQLLVPREEHKDYEHEEQEYTLKLDQLDAKWRIQSLRAAAEHFHREREGTILGTLDDDEDDEDEDYVEGEDDEGDDDDDEDDSNDDDVDIEGEWYQDDDDEEGARRGGSFTNGRRRQRQLEERRRSRQQRNRYPELKVENMVDGRLRVTRNVLLDTEDANEDGIISMRVGLALVEFPSILELYSENQECSLAILKMEEDEEMDTGFPFFMNESGDDDALVISDYSNEITLKVFDDGGNNVMQRTRAARHGTVDFPHLRLDVPAGEYTFHFSDDLYGTYLTVKTQLRELHETNDAPLDDGDAYSSYVLDESAANDRSRRGQRRRQRTESDEEDANLQWDDQDSDDSFIVNDDDGEEEPTGAFSDDEHEEGAWEFHSDDEEVDEAEAQRLLNIRRAPARQRRQNMIHDMTGSDWSGREDQDDEDHEDDENDPELVSQDTDVHEHQVHDNEDDDDAVHPQNTSARRRSNSNRVVIDSDDDEGHDEQDNDEREEKHDGDDQDAELVDHEEVVSSENADEAGDADEGCDGERRSKSDRTEECKESEDQQTSSSGEVSKEKTSTEGGDTRNEELSYVDVLQSSEHEVTPVRPAKRTRARNIVLSENEDEEEDEQEEKRLDRNDSKKQKTTHHVQFDDDEDNDEDMDDDTKYERMHPFLDEEREQLHEVQDADAEEQEEYFDYDQEDDDAEEDAFSENEPDDDDPYTNEEDPFQEDEVETPFNNSDDGDGWD